MSRLSNNTSYLSGMVKGIFVTAIVIGLGIVAFVIFAALNPEVIGTWFGNIVSAFQGAIQ